MTKFCILCNDNLIGRNDEEIYEERKRLFVNRIADIVLNKQIKSIHDRKIRELKSKEVIK